MIRAKNTSWSKVVIEHNGKRYYIVGNPDVDLNGLRVRRRKIVYAQQPPPLPKEAFVNSDRL